MKKLLVFDIGNTNTVVGVYDNKILVNRWRLTSDRKTSDEIGVMTLGLLSAAGISKDDIEGAIFGSVVPSIDDNLRKGVRDYIGVDCIRVSTKLNTGLEIKMKNRTGLGADRLLNAVAGIEKYGYPLIIVDLGTAITFDVVSRERAYIGGAIAPGMELGMNSLFRHTAKLPQTELAVPAHYIGGNTIEAIQSGIVYGTVGMVDSMVTEIMREMGEECHVIATGGHATLISAHSKKIHTVDQWLTLDGLRILYERNKVAGL